jgi:hypothetical protein
LLPVRITTNAEGLVHPRKTRSLYYTSLVSNVPVSQLCLFQGSMRRSDRRHEEVYASEILTKEDGLRVLLHQDDNDESASKQMLFLDTSVPPFFHPHNATYKTFTTTTTTTTASYIWPNGHCTTSMFLHLFFLCIFTFSSWCCSTKILHKKKFSRKKKKPVTSLISHLTTPTHHTPSTQQSSSVYMEVQYILIYV